MASGAKRVTENMLMASSSALANCSPLLKDPQADLLPPLGEIQQVSKVIAFEVAKAAMADGVAVTISDDLLQQKLINHSGNLNIANISVFLSKVQKIKRGA